MVESLEHRRTTSRWVFGVALAAILGALILVLVVPQESPSAKGPGVPSAESQARKDPRSASPTTTAKPSRSAPSSKVPASPPPATADFRALASAAAVAIYSWDTRNSSYSDVYARIRDWWVVLPDGSNPLAVLAQEFEATGINAGLDARGVRFNYTRPGNSEAVMERQRYSVHAAMDKASARDLL